MAESPDTTATGLTHERIVDAASDLIAAEGFRGLSMRKLGDRLGCAAMSLYRYFATKEELLSVLADQLVAEIELPDREAAWDTRIIEYFVNVEQLFQRHPELAEISTRQHLNSTSAFRGVEMVLGALREAGLDSEQAVSAWYALTFFTAGFSYRRATEHADRDRDGGRRRRIGALPREEFEHFHEIAAMYTGGLSDRDFESALRVVLAGVATLGKESRR
ncbi:Tetracycline repressor protein class A [Mycobacterium talmoniae]|uniref:Tetracycline repressor protein class A n=1 Tax=Mycobacterium talmoniae TaxID=1858794 RepID=A0A2S8BMW2_9MYCO|nr:Tetracycline repressor protein class A [Mycobacterium talmoniae]